VDSALGLLILAIAGIAVPAGMISVAVLVGKKRGTTATSGMPYECGAKPFDTARQRFSAKFYLVAMLFILFDIEAVFLYPWAVQLKTMAAGESGIFTFFAMIAFLSTLVIGFWYVWKRGALEWDR
jgi:NADH-quinone oxidoreductase subunit A